MSVDELLKHVPPEVVYHRDPVAEEDNALGPLEEAFKHLVVPEFEEDPVWERALCGSSETEEDAEDESEIEWACEVDDTFEFPTGQDGEHIRAILEKNGRALELLDEAVRRGTFQLPTSSGRDTWWKLVDIQAARSAGRVRKLKAKALAVEGKFAEAADELAAILGIGRMLCGGDCCVVHYLVGQALSSMASATIPAFATIEDVPEEVLRSLLSAVQRILDVPDGLAQTVRFDFCCCDLDYVDQLPDGGSEEDLVEAFLAEYSFDDELLDKLGHADIDEGEYDTKWKEAAAQRRQRFLFLLGDHPRPFDKIATTRLLGEECADTIRRLGMPDRPRLLDFSAYWFRLRRWFRRRRARQANAWPFAVTHALEAFGNTDEEIRERVAEMEEHFGKAVAEYMMPPTEEQLVAAREQLRQIDNPLGLLFAEKLSTGGDMYAESRAMNRQRLERARNVLQERLGFRCGKEL